MNKNTYTGRKPRILGMPYFPKPGENRMSDVGDVAKAREYFLSNRPSNLVFLLDKRYSWMNSYIGEGDRGIEIGCGHGLSKEFIKSADFVLTDFIENPWVEIVVDAMNMPFEDSSLDFIVSGNMIHHIARPPLFFRECSRVLKKGGKLLVQEINASLAMRAMLRAMRHEGYSYDTDVFDVNTVCNDPADPWSANCAIPNLLFDDAGKFESNFRFKMVRHSYTEFFLLPLSGGVIAKRKTVNLPKPVLNLLDRVDDMLIFMSKGVFPLQKQVVLINEKTTG